MLWFLTARTLLKESQIMLFCRRTLCAIIDKPRSVEAVEVSKVIKENIKTLAYSLLWCV